MNDEIDILGIKKWILSNTITVKAIINCECVIEGLLRPIKVKMYNWEIVKIKIPKNKNYKWNRCLLKDIVTKDNKRDFPNWEWL